MMRNKSSSAMQKTYDDCYLICSTAVYFEGQNNEAEALRSWRSALDQIYYHNAYKTPLNYVPKNETERALMESLRNMELQCKERVEILDALRKSRKEAEKSRHSGDASSATSASQSRPPAATIASNTSSALSPNNWMGDGTVPPLSSTDVPRAAPPLPQRPVPIQRVSDIGYDRPHSTPQFESLAPPPPSAGPATLPVPPKKTSRTPSPDKKGGRVMLTTLRGPKDSKGRPTKPTKLNSGRSNPPPASSKAAGLAWDITPKAPVQKGNVPATLTSAGDLQQQDQLVDLSVSRNGSLSVASGGSPIALQDAKFAPTASHTPPDLNPAREPLGPRSFETARKTQTKPVPTQEATARPHISSAPAAPKPAATSKPADTLESKPKPKPAPEYPSYRTEFPPTAPSSKATAEFNARIARREESPQPSSNLARHRSPPRKAKDLVPNGIKRKPMAVASSPRPRQQQDSELETSHSSESNEDHRRKPRTTAKRKVDGQSSRSGSIPLDPALSTEDEGPKTWEERVKLIRKNLPKGVDEGAAKQIFNEIVVRGDEVHWADVAGLDTAKKALKEAVVYPFLRPDLFMGLREPARGMLLFGPPGTGKTMLARAVATESQSTFFAISASSLTSKWLGESEKLVRALFLLAKALAPSIIFVDEIDSLLSSRGGSSEHETTRRIKTEFLIQWSDLQRAAAGSKQSDKDKTEGDATRVLVLAATNMPWAIDEAARRRFVRRQYIPLPEAPVRAEQLRTLLGHQKHNLNRQDIQVLVELTDGFSGSDITALAKDAAMGPLRSLGEALLYMSMDEIRPINFSDFESSLLSIRPSVNKQGLQEYENWAKEFGERGV